MATHEAIRAAAASDAVRFLRFDISAVARAAGCSEALVRRYLNGERVGPQSAARIGKVLGQTDD